MDIRIVDSEPPYLSTTPMDGAVYVNANIRAEQWDALNEKLDRILAQQTMIMAALNIPHANDKAE